MYVIQHCFIDRPTDSNVSEDAGIERRTVATLALTARRSNHSARSHPHSATVVLLEKNVEKPSLVANPKTVGCVHVQYSM